MNIAKQVAQLPEVGYPLTNAAQALDDEQARIDRLQDDLNARRMQFLVSLRDEWTAEEIVGAGLFF